MWGNRGCDMLISWRNMGTCSS
uniref:Uncharacterized protein n=1 Tax=Rhizophora mucronata TaxID=61149 RepID=A0A2P2R0Y5_RHIMU